MVDIRLIERDSYLEQLEHTKQTPDIKVITGVRRSGKSKLLGMFIKKIQSSEKNANIIHVDFNLLKFEPLLEYHKLHDFVENSYQDGKDNYVMIDEIQMCENFEKAVNSLHALEKYHIYVTGSNAFLLSSDLATLFTGRTFELKIYPFSFKEYVKYYQTTDVNKAFDSYLEEGGMPGSYLYNKTKEKYSYINDEVFNALIVRDIIRRYKIRNVNLLNKLVDFLMDNIGNITSVRKIADTLTSNKIKTNDKTVGKYIDYLCNAFAFYRIRRYDISGKRYLTTDDKFYLSDHSFKFARLGTKNLNTGRVIENVVAIELLRRGYEVYVGTMYNGEIDFVAMKQNEKIYFQVSDDISNKDTFDREVSPLLKIKDAYPKILLARTRQKEFQYEGIRIINLADWLNSYPLASKN